MKQLPNSSVVKLHMSIAAVAVVLVALSSCADHGLLSGRDYDSCIDISDSSHEKVRFIDQAGAISFVPMESSEESIYRNADKTVVRGDTLFVGDSRSGKIIAFSVSSGKYLFSISRKGRAGGEYIDMTSFSVFGGKVFVLDNMGRKIVAYSSETGQSVGSYEIDLVAWDLEAVSDDRFFLSFVPMYGGKLARQQTRSMLIEIDSACRQIRTMLPYRSDYCEPFVFRPAFANDGSSITFSTVGMNGVMTLDASSASPLSVTSVRFDNGIPSPSILKGGEEALSGYSYLVSTPIRSGDWLNIVYNEKGHPVTSFVNVTSGKIVQDEFAYCFSPAASSDGCFYSIVEDQFISEYLLGCGQFEFSEDVIDAFSNRRPVLVKYSLGR